MSVRLYRHSAGVQPLHILRLAVSMEPGFSGGCPDGREALARVPRPAHWREQRRADRRAEGCPASAPQSERVTLSSLLHVRLA